MLTATLLHEHLVKWHKCTHQSGEKNVCLFIVSKDEWVMEKKHSQEDEANDGDDAHFQVRTSSTLLKHRTGPYKPACISRCKSAWKFSECDCLICQCSLKKSPVSTGDPHIIQWQPSSWYVCKAADTENRLWSEASERGKASRTGETAERERACVERGGLHRWACNVSSGTDKYF